MELVVQTSEHFLTSLAFTAEGELLTVCAASGELLRCDIINHTLQSLITVEGSPVGLAVDGGRGQVLLTCPLEQCVARVALEYAPVTPNSRPSTQDGGEDEEKNKAPANALRCHSLAPLYPKHDDRLLSSPTAIALAPNSGELVLSDAGGEGDSSLANPVGGLFRTVQQQTQIVPLCEQGLCRPAGIAVDRDGCIYVCEMGLNRLLRFVPKGSYYVAGVFAHFQGSMGPSAVAVSPRDGTVFVTLHEPDSLGCGYATHEQTHSEEKTEESNNGVPLVKDGTTMVLGRDGADKGIIVTPGSALRAVAVDRQGVYVYILHADEAACVSTIYRCPIE